MDFGSDHYVPVLKMKRGEKRALQALAPAIRTRLTPLLEIVERKPDKAPTVAGHLNTAFKDLDAAVAGYPRYFIDCREIAGDGATAASTVFRNAATLPTPFTPVTGISRTADVKAALAHRKNGLAIRLTRDEFEAVRIPRELPAFMTKHGLTPEGVDLIVDLGPVDTMVAQGVEAMQSAFLADVPHLRRWRTLTVSACAFPNSMGVVERNSHELIDRAEWLAWRDGLHANRSSLERLPTFSDYAIQHPSGVEGFDPRIMAVSASVRITVRDQWLLIKGESTRSVPPSVQFPALATRLVYGHLVSHYSGREHCSGCEDMHRAADGAPSLGSAEAWRRLGTIHHLTRAAEEVATLPWP
jgi:hypothetical protein